jgi:diguanylate cyclase (GGDEF)-like protein
MFIDLDGFKEINDSYGHRFGDQLLIMFAQLLCNTLPNDAFIVRTGGDEFVVLLACHEDLNLYISRITERLNAPFNINTVDTYITASIGIALYPLDTTNAEELLQNADAAMYDAKKEWKKQS